MGKREIRGNWAQFLAVIGIGGIAVTLFVGLLANAQSIEDRVNECYDEGNMADIWVTTSAYQSADLKRLSAVVGDDGEVEGRFEAQGRVARNSVFTAVSPQLPTVSKPYQLESLSSDPAHFVYVDSALSSVADETIRSTYQVGKSIDVAYDLSSYVSQDDAAMLDQFLLPGAENILKQSSIAVPFTITGLMSYPENVKKASYSQSTILIDDETFHQSINGLFAKTFSSDGLGYLYEAISASPLGWDDSLSTAGVFASPNQYLVSLKDHARVQDVKERINAYFSAKGNDNLFNVSDRSSMPFVITMHNDVVQARQFTFLFPFVFFFVAVLVILTTTSQIILKERGQIGTMKALGLSSKEIYAHYMGLSMAVVAIGILIGEILGPILIPYLLGMKYDILYSLPARTYVFPTLYGLLTAVVFLLLTALVTFLVCRKEVRLNPAESMRPSAIAMKTRDGEKTKKKSSALSLSFRMAFRNIRLSPLKSVMVVTGVMGCTALLLCGFGIENTVYYGINHDMDLANSAAISLTFSSPQSRESLASDLASLPGVASFEPYSRMMSTASFNETEDSTYLYVLGDDVNSHFKVDFPIDKAAVSRKSADKLGLSVGDKVSFTYGSSTYEETVSCIFDAFVFNGVAVHASNPLLVASGEVDFQGAYIDKTSGESPSLSELKETLLGLPYVSEALTQQDWWNQINDVMSGVLVMTNAVKVFAILLAIVVLYNLALLNFRERTRDIATLKVLGFSKNEIATSLLWETMTLTFLGVFFGMFLGYPFMLGVLKLNIVDLVSYLYTIYPVSYLYAFLLTFVVAFAVNFWLSFRTGKVKMVESLKSVE